jgi:hypothetical protein
MVQNMVIITAGIDTNMIKLADVISSWDMFEACNSLLHVIISAAVMEISHFILTPMGNYVLKIKL